MINRFKKVTDKLFRGSAPNINDVIFLKNNYNINKIVSLDKSSGKLIDKICKKLNIDHKIIPLDGSKKSLVNLLRHDLKKLLISNGPTFVHCKHGKDRTGLVCALFSCQYLNKSPTEALQEAKELDFGKGLDLDLKKLYENLILKCKSDENNLDIVTNQRTYGDDKDSYLFEADRKSTAPYLDYYKQHPYDFIYNDIYTQSPTRENISEEKEYDNLSKIPLVGLFNNSGGAEGFGPTVNINGFIYD